MQEYPKWVTPDRAAWVSATTPEARRAAKVLVQDEAAHRLAAPADFAANVDAAVDEAPVRRGPGRPRKVSQGAD